jgi:hypothetical protein
MGTYIVQKGDTLSGIGERLFGDPEFWRSEEFRAANPDIKNVNRIAVGQVINIPGYEPEEEAIPLPRPRPAPPPPPSPMDSVPTGVGANKAAMAAARHDGSAGLAYVSGAPGVMAPDYPAGAGGARPNPGRRPVTRQAPYEPVVAGRPEYPGALPAARPSPAQTAWNDPSRQHDLPGAITRMNMHRPDLAEHTKRLIANARSNQNPSAASAEPPVAPPSAASLLKRGVERAIPDEGPNFDAANPGPQLTLTLEQLERIPQNQRSTLASILSAVLPEQNLFTDLGWLAPPVTSRGN